MNKLLVFLVLFSLLLIFGCTQQQVSKEGGEEKTNKTEQIVRNETKQTSEQITNESINQTISEKQTEQLTEEELNDLFNTDLDKAIEELNITG